MQALAVFMSVVLAAIPVPSPSDVISVVGAPDDFELVDAQPGLSFADYAELEPEAVAHVDADSDVAAAMTAAVDIWTSGEEDILLRQVTRWGDRAGAEAYIEQVSRTADADGLDARPARIVGGIEYAGEDETRIHTQLVGWQQGRLAIVIELFTVGERDDEVVGQQAEVFAVEIGRVTGIDVLDGDSSDDNDGDSGDAEPEPSGGGIPITTVLFWMLIVGGAIWAFVKLRKRLRRATSGDTGSTGGAVDDPSSNGADDGDERSVDDIIERARARRRAQAEVDAIPDPTEEWTPPDDY